MPFCVQVIDRSNGGSVSCGLECLLTLWDVHLGRFTLALNLNFIH
jgi:hypothetical protein